MVNVQGTFCRYELNIIISGYSTFNVVRKKNNTQLKDVFPLPLKKVRI